MYQNDVFLYVSHLGIFLEAQCFTIDPFVKVKLYGCKFNIKLYTKFNMKVYTKNWERVFSKIETGANYASLPWKY